jgi:GT2 family glycosyltransferase
MSEPLAVSVLIVNWNAREHLRGCLDSLRTQTLAHETIVLDNASSDGSATMVRRDFPNVPLIVSEKNLGFAAGNNQAAKRATGTYLLLLNPDTTLPPDCLEKMVAFARRQSALGALGPQLLNPDGSRQRSCWRGFPGIRMALEDALYLWKFSRLPLAHASEYRTDELREPRPVDHLLGACLLIPREAWEQVGPLDENYFLFLEETDWCLRAQRAGRTNYYFPYAQVTHYGQASMRQEPSRNIPQFYKSYLRFYRAQHGQRAFGAVVLKGIFALACLIRIGMWRKRESGTSDGKARELARGMGLGYRQTLSELGTF